MLVVEGQSAAEQRVQNHAAGPDVHFGTRVETTGDDFGGCVVRRAAGSAEEAAVF